MAKILIIENQQSHFLAIADHLKRKVEHEIHPIAKERYILNYVRVFLNIRYPEERRKTAKAELFRYLMNHSFDLFIIDHKLIGAFDGLTGINLGEEIRGSKEESIRAVPIIFLSATRTNESSVKDHRDKISDSDWIEKGYAGIGLRDKHYFERHIQPTIDLRLNASWRIVEEKLDKLASSEMLRSHINEIEHFRTRIIKINKVPIADFLECFEKIMAAKSVVTAENTWTKYYENFKQTRS